MNRDEARGYLAAIIDGEGTIVEGSRQQREIRIYNTDLLIIGAVNEALDLLGIGHYSYPYSRKDRPTKPPLVRVVIGRREDVIRAYEEIPLRSVKRERLRNLVSTYRRIPYDGN